MKVVDKQLPAVTPFDLDRRTADLKGVPVQRQSRAQPVQRETRTSERAPRQSSTYSLQLNQQLSSIQSANSYLNEVQSRLSQLKLKLSAEVSAASSQSVSRQQAREALQKVNAILDQRSRNTGNVLDASFQLKLNEPVRIRFSLQGLENIEQVRASGQETLVFSAGRQLSEPLAVVLDDGMSVEQTLRRFNLPLNQAGLRAEIDPDGSLKFSARESDWTALRDELAVQGEGKLFAKGHYARVESAEDGLLGLPSESTLESVREMRQILDSVVSALDRVTQLREQIRERESDIRLFLAEHLQDDERQWAQTYVEALNEVMHRGPVNYVSQAQVVVSQANLTRYSVVSLLS